MGRMKIGKIYTAGKVSEAVAEFQLFKFHMARFNISRPQEADRGNSNCSCLKATCPEGLFLPPSCFICQSNLKVILSLPTRNTWPECGARSNFLIRSWEAFSTFLSVAQRCVQRSVISSLGKPLMYGSTRRRE